MQIFSIAEVLQMPDGQLLEGVKGIVIGIYDQKTGENGYGPWSIQNVTLGDGKDKIKLKLSNRDSLDGKFKGQHIHLIAHQCQKGVTGLKIELDTYKGETSKIIKVTESAEIVQTEQSGSGAQSETRSPAQAAPAPAEQPRSQPASFVKKFCPDCGVLMEEGKFCWNTGCQPYTPPPPPELQPPKGNGPVMEANRTLGQKASLMVLTGLKTLQIVGEFCRLAEIPLTAEELKDAARLIARNMMTTTHTTLFISGEKLGLDHELPVKTSDVTEIVEEIRKQQAAK
jgi:hypothetical protein